LLMEYSIRINDIQPESIREPYKDNKVFLGVSINTPIFRKRVLKHLLKWIAENCHSCEIVITDYLHRYNKQIFCGLNSDDAIREALQLGEELKRSISLYVHSYPAGRFTVHRWLNYYESEGFKRSLFYIRQVFRKDVRFKSAVITSATDFIDGQVQTGRKIQNNLQAAVDLSVEYLLEEMAFIDLMASNGTRISIYPGTQLGFLKAIARGEYPKINSHIRNSIYVDLAVKKKARK